MNSAKGRQRNKFFACLRQADIDEFSIKRRRNKDCPGSPVFISVQGDEKMVLPKILKSISEEKLEVHSDASDGHQREERSRRSFSRALKAVLFKTSLVKNLRNRKQRRNSFQTRSSIVSDEIKKASNDVNINPIPIKSSEADSSRCSSPNHSSSVSTSALVCSPRGSPFRAFSVESERVNKPTSAENGSEAEGYSSNIGLYLLLVCLLVLILWGRFCAIFFTLMFLFLIRWRRIKRFGHVGCLVNDVDSSSINEVDPVAYKKRIIMEDCSRGIADGCDKTSK